MAELQPGRRVFLVTYTPLCATAAGRDAVTRFRLPPYIDGSIRREPDLQHTHPSISCLCRAGKFAPRLAVGDHVIYMPHKRLLPDGERGWRLTAVLRVRQTFPSHAAAAAWYRHQGLPLPSNCMVPGNEPTPLEQSHRKTSVKGCSRVLELWDAEYRKRATTWPIFVVCDPVFRRLQDPPSVHESDFEAAFGCPTPGTQNPASFDVALLPVLLERLGLRADGP